jgi:tetratricopeptide (TPR) repeat protein
LRAKVAMAVLLLDEEEEDEADELLDEILDEDATCTGALLAKARLALSDGLPGEAIEYLDRGIKQAPNAALYYMKAKSLQRQAKDKPALMEPALDAAARALGMEPTPEHIKLYDELLKETGDAATATKALKEHFGRTQHPLLGAMLAESAFKAGDYEAALMGLGIGDSSDLATVKALAEANARLGKADLAQRHARRVVDMDSLGRLFAARIDLWLGAADDAKKRLGSLADEDAKRIRAYAHAWAGEADAAKQLVAKDARDGNRAGEELLIAWFQARLFEKLGASKADTLRKLMLAARFKAASKPVAQGGHWSTDIGKAKTEGWPSRAVTWFRAPCGVFFRAGPRGSSSSINIGDNQEFTLSRSISGEADCGGAKQSGSFTYNAKTVKTKNGQPPWVELLNPDTQKLADLKPAEKAFAEACAAWIDGKQDAAESACLEALKIEPNWSRITVLRAIARSLFSEADLRADAKEAMEAVALWTDDFELRRAVIVLRAWAGDAALAKEIEALAQREAEFNVRKIDSL